MAAPRRGDFGQPVRVLGSLQLLSPLLAWGSQFRASPWHVAAMAGSLRGARRGDSGKTTKARARL
jgi:hypothetical protein